MNEQEERDLIRYDYRLCCYDHGLPFVGVEPSRWTDQIQILVRVSNIWIEQAIASGEIEAYGVDIAKRLIGEYRKYKAEKDANNQARPRAEERD